MQFYVAVFQYKKKQVYLNWQDHVYQTQTIFYYL